MSAVNEWARSYDLSEARRHPSRRDEAAHQTQALDKLRAWYESAPTPDAGGLLVLPTGAGKTFTAVRFLCRHPLSDGYKVLWLAHTHHLLEQALDGFGKRADTTGELEVGWIHEPKERLLARVVSGTLGHNKIADITPNDDVVICTLQTAVRAYREKHTALHAFLSAAKGKLIVVFDEAHHAPAPSYTEFILALRREAPQMKLLGLTATPMYNDQKREGWLTKLFPQEILYSVGASSLIAQGILAKPIPIPCATKFAPKFDPAQFQRWRVTYQDVPPEIITKLAENQARNDTIWKTYVDRREEFGKTIIFADRWFQCDYLREKLRARGVRADVVYSHFEAGLESVEARNARSRDENDAVLQAFRDGQLDVLINVRMLTEGTDVPNVQTVFLTRQTTSQILLRQMVGRALRGPKFGGTATANIVLFIDEWREAIQWAEFDEVWGTGSSDARAESRKRVPLQLVSIELVRQLSRQMESGEIAPASFTELLPLGWYVPEFDVEVPGSEDTEHLRPMVLVYGDEKAHYDKLLKQVAKHDLLPFAHPGVEYDDVAAQIEAWRNTYFPEAQRRTSALNMNLFHLVRHLAQTYGQMPPFFPFEQRDEHDLTPLAQTAAAEDWGPLRTQQQLEALYIDTRRFWRAMYPTFDLFCEQFRMLVMADIRRKRGAVSGASRAAVIAPAPPRTDVEVPDEVKREVIRRDGGQCLCCGSTRRLEIDHVIPRYHGGTNDPSNLQTLCATCNRDKAIKEINFRHTSTLLTARPPLRFPAGFDSDDLDALAHDIQRTLNLFYQCAAVDEIEIKKRGVKRREWRIRLRSGNPRVWFDEHLLELCARVQAAQASDPYGPVRRIVFEAPGDNEAESGGPFFVYFNFLETTKPLPTAKISPRTAVAVYLPERLDLPNEPLPGKVIRVDTRKRLADVRVTLARAERELSAVPFKALFDPSVLAGGAGDQG